MLQIGDFIVFPRDGSLLGDLLAQR